MPDVRPARRPRHWASRTSLPRLVRLALALLLGAVGALPPAGGSVYAQADPCAEPNNGFNNACFVGSATPSVQGFISQPNDVDAYKFEIQAPLADVRIELGSLPADYDLHLFSGNAGFVTESVVSGLGSDRLELPLFRGTYFVFINSAQGQAAADRPYSLSIAVNAQSGPRPGLAGDPCPEPNGANESACPITPGRLAFGSIADSEDVDFFKFDVAEADSRVTIALGDVPAGFLFSLYKASGELEGTTDSFSTLIGRVQPGSYFVELTRQEGDGYPTPYELLVTLTPPALAPVAGSNDPCPEPNDENDKACSIGTAAPAVGFISNPADIDRYRFEVPGGPHWVHLELVDLPADYDLEVQDSADVSLAATHNSGTFPEALDLLLEPGAYFVPIYSLVAQGSDERPYRLNLSMVPAGSGARPAATVLFADNFNAVGTHFSYQASTPDRFEVGTYDGEYVVTLHHARADHSSEEHDEPAHTDLADFQLDLDARLTRLPREDGGFTVSFRWQDDLNTYELYVDVAKAGGPGSAKLVRWVAGEGTELTGWVESGAIKTGSESNHVSVRAVGSDLAVSINGQPVLQARDSTFSSGDLALGAITWDEPTEARFDNLIVVPPR
jgi:hypothetical protein